MTQTTQLKPTQIRTDGGTQPRATLDRDTITEYADAMRRGDTFPRLVLFHDGDTYWLADGFHRLAAHKEAHGSAAPIEVDVRIGTQRDAILHSAGVNADHGLRRTNEDKRRSVIRLLEDEEWGKWSDREIGRRAKVSNAFVSKIRSEIHTVNGTQYERTFIHPKTGQPATMNTANIGATQKEEEEIRAEFYNEYPHPDLPDGWTLKMQLEGWIGYHDITRKTTIAYDNQDEAVQAVLAGDYNRENWSHHLCVRDLAHGNFVYYFKKATADQVRIALEHAPKLRTAQTYIQRLEARLRALESGRATPETESSISTPRPTTLPDPNPVLVELTLDQTIGLIWKRIKTKVPNPDIAERLAWLKANNLRAAFMDRTVNDQPAPGTYPPPETYHNAAAAVIADLEGQIAHQKKTAAKTADQQSGKPLVEWDDSDWNAYNIDNHADLIAPRPLDQTEAEALIARYLERHHSQATDRRKIEIILASGVQTYLHMIKDDRDLTPATLHTAKRAIVDQLRRRIESGAPAAKPSKADPTLTVTDVVNLIQRALRETTDPPLIDAYTAGTWSLYLAKTYNQWPTIDTTRQALAHIKKKSTPLANQAPAPIPEHPHDLARPTRIENVYSAVTDALAQLTPHRADAQLLGLHSYHTAITILQSTLDVVGALDGKETA